MAILRATSILNPLSGVEKDASRNVWHFATPTGTPTTDEITTTADAVAGFYTALGAKFSPEMSRVANIHRVEIATVSQGVGGEEDDVVSELIHTKTFTIASNVVTQSLPAEVAIALSFRGDIDGVPEEEQGGLVRPRSSRRGRVFLGPWATNALGVGANSQPVVAASLVTDILTAYQGLLTALAPAGAAKSHHIVYSRKRAGSYTVLNAHVDTEFDIIRTRTRTPLGRTAQDVTQAGFVL